MKLISSADTLAFLTKNAPRPWIRRMLSWMAYQGELVAYFTRGSITPVETLLGILISEEIDISQPRAEIDLAIRKRFNPAIADKLVRSGLSDKIEDDIDEWEGGDEPRTIGPGLFIFAEDIDWESGELVTEIDNQFLSDRSYMFDNEDLFGSAFRKPDFVVRLGGLSFSRDQIEMLCPNADSGTFSNSTIVAKSVVLGRPRKWDWDGALAHIVAVANTPDGLPIGPNAQARIEELIADWFVGQTGGAPSESQIREKASTVVRSVSPKKPLPAF